MVKESDFTRELIKRLRQRLPEAWICKFNDQITGGIPDFCIVREGETWWFEVKTESKLSTLQRLTIEKIQKAYIIQWYKKSKTWWIHTLDEVVQSNGEGLDSLVQELIVTTGEVE